jgi:hypothetical protein
MKKGLVVLSILLWALSAIPVEVMADDGLVRILRIEVTQIPEARGEQAAAAEARLLRVVDPRCPELREGFLVATVDGIAVVLATEPIPQEAGGRLAEAFVLHTPKADILYSFCFEVQTERTLWTTVRSTLIPDGCVILSSWERVVSFLKLKRSKDEGRA